MAFGTAELMKPRPARRRGLALRIGPSSKWRLIFVGRKEFGVGIYQALLRSETEPRERRNPEGTLCATRQAFFRRWWRVPNEIDAVSDPYTHPGIDISREKRILDKPIISHYLKQRAVSQHFTQLAFVFAGKHRSTADDDNANRIDDVG